MTLIPTRSRQLALRRADFRSVPEMLDYAARSAPFAVVGYTFVVNENIFVLRRHGTRWGPVLTRQLSSLR